MVCGWLGWGSLTPAPALYISPYIYIRRLIFTVKGGSRLTPAARTVPFPLSFRLGWAGLGWAGGLGAGHPQGPGGRIIRIPAGVRRRRVLFRELVAVGQFQIRENHLSGRCCGQGRRCVQYQFVPAPYVCAVGGDSDFAAGDGSQLHCDAGGQSLQIGWVGV